MSQNIAFIGLGIMGLPMAKNLVNAGYNVTGYNRSDKAGNEEYLYVAPATNIGGHHTPKAKFFPKQTERCQTRQASVACD